MTSFDPAREFDYIDEDPVEAPTETTLDDVHTAYADGYADAIDDCVLCVKALVKATNRGQALRHADMLKLERTLAAKAD